MKCTKCGMREANVHIKTVLNGALSEEHLCTECAKESGVTSQFTGANFPMTSFGNMFQSMFSEASLLQDEQRCESCGSSFDEIVKGNKMGCPECYDTFHSRLNPMINRTHGSSRHVGKKPGDSTLAIQEANVDMVPVREETPLEEKQRLLKKAIEEQNFEQAAVLRDEIKGLEKE